MRCTSATLFTLVVILIPAGFSQYPTTPYKSTIIAGGGPPDGTAATLVALSAVQGVAVDGSGNLYVASGPQNRVYIIAPGGLISTVAGNGAYGYSGDGGPAVSAQLSNPSAVAIDGAGNLYIADSGNYRIRKVSGGIMSTVAGIGVPGFAGDGGPATSAQISFVQDVAVDSAGNLYIADTGNARIRRISGGVISTVAGNGTWGYSGDEGPAMAAALNTVMGVAVDGGGNLYIADSQNYRVRKVSPGGIITTVAGNGTYGYSFDGIPATSASIQGPYDVAVDSAGNFYYSDGSRVRKVSEGVVTTVAGTSSYGYSGDGGPATSAQMTYASGLAIDSTGTLYIADRNNYRVRKVSAGIISTIGGNGTYGYSGDGGPGTNAQLNPGGLVVSAGGICILPTRPTTASAR